MIPPQGFRHAVDLFLKNTHRKGLADPQATALALIALGIDMKAPVAYAPWVIAEFERVLGQAAPPVLHGFGSRAAAVDDHRDLFLVYVPEDRLPVAAPLAVELVKRRVTVAFSEYEIDTAEGLEQALARGPAAHRAGVVLATPSFLKRGLSAPVEGPHLKLLTSSPAPARDAELLQRWLSKTNTTSNPE
jgi:hypothetical protein